MSEFAIRVAGLGKQYRIGAQRESYRTLRETVARWAVAPLHAVRTSRAGRTKRSDSERTIWALQDVSFEIRRGEVVGIIGRNGAGKSTLLKILSRITEPTQGFAEIAGRVGSLLEVGTGFHPELTGRENIYLNAVILGMNRAEVARKFEQIVEFAEVQKFIDTPVKHYSSGMYLRLAFSVAAHLEPDILLVDEVLAVGDAAFQKKCLGRMGEVAQEGRTVLFVSHNMGAVRSLCEQGIFLQDGHICQSGPVANSIEAYYRALGVFDSDSGSPGGEADSRSCFGPVFLNGRTGNSILQGEEFELSTSLRIDRPVSGFFLFCMLEDMHGRDVFILREQSNNLGLNDVAAGRYRFTVKLPPLWLSPGLYSAYFKVLFWQESRASARHESDKFPLDVDGQSSIGATQNPVLHPRAAWSAEGALNSDKQLV